MKRAARILANSVLGLMALFLFNAAGAAAGMSAGLNFVNAGIVGVLGIPGFALVLVLQYLAV